MNEQTKAKHFSELAKFVIKVLVVRTRTVSDQCFRIQRLSKLAPSFVPSVPYSTRRNSIIEWPSEGSKCTALGEPTQASPTQWPRVTDTRIRSPSCS